MFLFFLKTLIYNIRVAKELKVNWSEHNFYFNRTFLNTFVIGNPYNIVFDGKSHSFGILTSSAIRFSRAREDR